MKMMLSKSRLLFAFLTFLSVASKGSTADKGSPIGRVVLDSTSAKTRVMLKNKLRSSVANVDLREAVERAKKEFKTVSAKAKVIGRETSLIVDKFKDNLQHYSRKEIGIYAALTVALTVTLKNVVFSKSSLKNLDIGKLYYILSSAAATVAIQNIVTSGEVRLTPSIVSEGGKTYINTEKKPLSTHTRPSEQVTDTVVEFYPEYEVRSYPSYQSAPQYTISPVMRNSRMRVRGGASSEVMKRLEIGGYFAAWYALNVVYNIVNKKILNVLPAPLIVGSIQFGVGALYAVIVWALKFRPRPTLSKEGKKVVASVGAYHMLGQLATMIALGAGPVSFTHIVKAVEPFFSAMVSGFWFKKWMPLQVYATLIPVVGGVGYACMKELNFSWLAFGAALSSNLFFALRAVVSKSALQGGKAVGTNLTAPNMFGLVTIAAFIISIPVGLIQEGSGFLALWSAALEQVESKKQLIRAIIMSGLFHYLNNEVMYMALGQVHPVTLAVGNTMKRVFILVASVLVFRNPVTVQAGIGSAVGISGVLLYSLVKQHYESLESKAPPKGRRRR